jgi:Kef-type K+ transport system membrane component KefB
LKKSFFVTLYFLTASSLLIGLIIYLTIGIPFHQSLVYSIPLSIASSAIVIPSVMTFPELKKQFMIYESIFSDIIGILLFNIIVYFEISNSVSASGLIVSLLATLSASIIISILLAFAVDRIRIEVKFVFIITVLVLFYSIGKLINLSSMLFVLSFGLLITNLDIVEPFLNKRIEFKYFKKTMIDFKTITAELSFLVRSIFFVIFGYSINIIYVFNLKIVLIGGMIAVLIYFVRFINLRMFVKKQLYPEILISPRGLITILLFYAIPQWYPEKQFIGSILVFVILITCIIMTFGLLFFNEKKGPANIK